MDKHIDAFGGQPDRRGHSRIETSLFTVFKRKTKKNDNSRPQIGYTRDITPRGVYFYTQTKPERGDNVFLSIHLSADWAGGGTPPKLEGEGKVLRVENAARILPLDDFNGVAVRLNQELALST
jgi:hypothetical protein